MVVLCHIAPCCLAHCLQAREEMETAEAVAAAADEPEGKAGAREVPCRELP